MSLKKNKKKTMCLKCVFIVGYNCILHCWIQYFTKAPFHRKKKTTLGLPPQSENMPIRFVFKQATLLKDSLEYGFDYPAMSWFRMDRCL